MYSHKHLDQTDKKFAPLGVVLGKYANSLQNNYQCFLNLDHYFGFGFGFRLP